MKKENFRLPTVGVSSLLMIFAVVCLVVFALLTISTVQGQGRLAQQSWDAVERYYEARNQAHTLLAELRVGKLPQGVNVSEGKYSFRCPMGETQYLQVEAKIEEDQVDILRWQVCSGENWEAEESLPVWR